MIHPPTSVDVHHGPLLLSGIDRGPGLAAHRARLGAPPERGIESLVAMLGEVGVRGRGGAGFPLARKLQTVAQTRGTRTGLGSRRPYVVVNAAEGEPGQRQGQRAPRCRTAPRARRRRRGRSCPGRTGDPRRQLRDRPWVGAAVTRATAERDDHGIRWVQHRAASRFVAGQSRSIVELMAGRPGLPVTSWAPEAVDGHRRRPTLLSNAESYAHLAAVVLWASTGTPRTAPPRSRVPAC